MTYTNQASDGSANKWNAESGNCFRTKEEAEYHRDWLIARKRIMESSITS